MKKYFRHRKFFPDFRYVDGFDLNPPDNKTDPARHVRITIQPKLDAHDIYAVQIRISSHSEWHRQGDTTLYHLLNQTLAEYGLAPLGYWLTGHDNADQQGLHDRVYHIVQDPYGRPPAKYWQGLATFDISRAEFAVMYNAMTHSDLLKEQLEDLSALDSLYAFWFVLWRDAPFKVCSYSQPSGVIVHACTPGYDLAEELLPIMTITEMHELFIASFPDYPPTPTDVSATPAPLVIAHGEDDQIFIVEDCDTGHSIRLNPAEYKILYFYNNYCCLPGMRFNI